MAPPPVQNGVFLATVILSAVDLSRANIVEVVISCFEDSSVSS